MAWIANENERVGSVNVGRGFGGGGPRGSYAGASSAATSAFLGRVFRTMAFGLGVTGLVAVIIASSPTLLGFFLGNPGVLMVVFLAQLGMVFAFGPVVNRASEGAAAAMFFAYSALMGVTMSFIFLRYTGASIGGTFLVTAGAFGGVAAYGAVTKRDLSGWGSFLFMGLIGLVLASIVNIFLHSPAIYWLTTFMGVIVFTGLAAYDTARLKQLAETYDVSGAQGRKLAIQGALTMYLNFINLFLTLLRIFGNDRRRS
ncbi:MAG TPA: Bax inhibitor-1/YccA family protein [Polyangia bacterium]|nr:Bax inhibitor-1/YccA family protein [Polyangia bacterium]